MARPRLGDSASQRLQMVITEDEVKAIEDWQFANRVPSKSEAIRRLVQIGLRVEREIPSLIMHSTYVTRRIESVIKNMKAKVGKGKDMPDADTLFGIVVSMFKDTDRALARQIEALNHLYMLADEIAPLVNAETFSDLSEALKAAHKTRAEVESGEHALQRTLAEFKSKEAKK
jgi:hypothetical protein